MPDHYSVFAHLSSPKAADYRRVLTAFAEARAGFVIHLRPAEVARTTSFSEDDLEPLLEQLAQWGNLDRSHDHVDAATVEEFYRVKWLYQLSARGEAAERALELFESSLHQPGELQTEALRDIIAYLEAIALLLVDNDGKGERPRPADAVDFAKLHQQVRELNARFEEFTVQAQRFMQFLQSTIELHDLTEDDFIDYKDRLIDYLQRFVNELITSAAEIEAKIERLERADIRDHFEGIAVRARADALDPNDLTALSEERSRLEGRWQGLRRWFLGDAHGGRSQAETLRARAREAIPSLLVALQSFHDRRESGSDRRRDWAQLARWFAEAPDDRSSHRLWRVAFGLGPARHLRINEETLTRREQSNDGARTSWLAAEPMWLEPQLRTTGRTPRSGRVAELVDLSREREMLHRLAAEENAQLARAHARLATGVTLHLSDFAELESAAFDLLMELLGHAVAKAAHRQAEEFPVTAHSSDGSLSIDLWLPARADRMTLLETQNGTLHGLDYRIAIRPADTEPEVSASFDTDAASDNQSLSSAAP